MPRIRGALSRPTSVKSPDNSVMRIHLVGHRGGPSRALSTAADTKRLTGIFGLDSGQPGVRLLPSGPTIPLSRERSLHRAP